MPQALPSLIMQERALYLNNAEYFILLVFTRSKNSVALVNNKCVVYHMQAMAKATQGVIRKIETNIWTLKSIQTGTYVLPSKGGHDRSVH